MRNQASIFIQTANADGITQSGTQINALTTSATFTSAPVFVGRALTYAVVVSTTSTLVGTVAIQGCCDESNANDMKPDAGLSTFYQLPNGAAQTLNSTTPVVFRETASCERWIRIVFTATSGSGAMTAKINYKGVN